VAEVLHTADLSERESQLMLRLQLGLPAALVPIASALGTNLNRPQYLALHRAALTTPAALHGADPEQLLTIVDGDKELRQLILDAAERLDELEQAA
jgi:helicase